MIAVRRLPRRARGLLLVAAAWAVTAVVGLVIVGTSIASGPASGGPARHIGGVRNPIGWNGNLYPLGPPGSGMAEKTTVTAAPAATGWPVPMPSTVAASRANLTQAWVSSTRHTPRKRRQVALVFDNGKIDILMHRATYQNALHYFHAFVNEKRKNGAPNAAIGQVNGRPALVISPPPNRSDIDFWRNGIFIAISSSTYGTHTLLAIASSMR